MYSLCLGSAWVFMIHRPGGGWAGFANFYAWLWWSVFRKIDYHPIVAFFYNEIYVFAMVSRHGLIHSLHLDDPRFPVIIFG